MLPGRHCHWIAAVLIALALIGCGSDGGDGSPANYTLTITKLGDGSGFVSTDPAGIQCGSDCSEQYTAGTVIKITAAPLSGSVLAGWSGGGCENPANLNPTQDICTLTLSANTEVIVFFDTLYNLTVTKQGDGTGVVASTPAGIQCGSDCSEEYLSGTAVTLTATPDFDSSFDGWSGACTGQGACVVTLVADTLVTAVFKRNYTLSVAKTNCGDGTVTSIPEGIDCGPDCSEIYPSGTDIVLTATPVSGSSFKAWSGACTGQGGCIINLAADTSVSAEFVKPDPYYPDQWHLKNTGQGGGTPGEDINVEPVWQSGLLGLNVRIAIVDDGMEIAHEDLAPNVVPGASIDYVGGDTDPTGPGDAPDFIGSHGTSVAGITAARDGGECIGGKGVAPRASLVGYNAIATRDDLDDDVRALTQDHTINSVSNNSWNVRAGASLVPIFQDVRIAIDTGLTAGRGGRGVVYVFSAGNDAEIYNEDGEIRDEVIDNSNYDGVSNYRGVMAVGAVDNKGVRESYSELGANLWLSAPAGNGEDCKTPPAYAILTTDDTGGEKGWNPPQDTDVYEHTDMNYTKCFSGTSASAPQVSGVAALILEANPTLGWRDVRLILAESARRNDPTDLGWATTTPPYHFNHNYGFGVVDATAAVNLARSWINVDPELTHTTPVAAPDLLIPDNDPVGESDAINVIGSGIDKIEWVDITFTSDHPGSGDLEITLTSPAGAVSELAHARVCLSGDPPVEDPNCNPYAEWIFGSARHLGETADGTWTLAVRDRRATHEGRFQSWQLKFYGTGQAVPVVFPDPALDACVREHINIPTGDIFPADLVNLTGLSCPGGYYHPDPITDLTGIEYASRLQTLWLMNNQISDISRLSMLASLVDIRIYANQLSDLAALTNLTNLERLYLAWNDINDLTPLAGLNNLQVLSLSFNPIGTLAPLSNLQNLVELWADESSLTDISVVANFPNLETLSLANEGFSSVAPNSISDLNPLTNLTRLTWLHLSNNLISDITPLSNLNEMTFLNVSGNSISDISVLSGLTKITELNISNNSIADIGPLATLTNITSLTANLNQIANLAPLVSLVNLTLLNLNDNSISDIGALVSNQGLGDFNYVYLVNNLLNTNCNPQLGDVKDCLDVEALRTRGVTVYWDGL